MPLALLLALLLPASSDAVSSDADEREAVAGWYELAPGRHVLVTFGASGGLRLFDFETPAFDVLAPGAQDYVWRHGEGQERRLAFERDERGAVTGFVWSGAGESGARGATTPTATRRARCASRAVRSSSARS